MSVVDDCSFIDFSHDISCTEKRYVVACVKTYDSTGTYITVKLFRKDNSRDQIQDRKKNCNSDGFKFNQRITLFLAEFERLTQSYNSLCEKLKAGQSEKSIKKECKKTTGRKRSYHLAFSSETNRVKPTQVADQSKKRANKNYESNTQY